MNQEKEKFQLTNWEIVSVNPADKNWKWTDYFCFWAVNIQSLIGFSLIALITLQLVLMTYFLKKPRQRALTYSAFGVPLLVTGMMVSASALRFVNVSEGNSFI